MPYDAITLMPLPHTRYMICQAVMINAAIARRQDKIESYAMFSYAIAAYRYALRYYAIFAATISRHTPFRFACWHIRQFSRCLKRMPMLPP